MCLRLLTKVEILIGLSALSLTLIRIFLFLELHIGLAKRIGSYLNMSYLNVFLSKCPKFKFLNKNITCLISVYTNTTHLTHNFYFLNVYIFGDTRLIHLSKLTYV